MTNDGNLTIGNVSGGITNSIIATKESPIDRTDL